MRWAKNKYLWRLDPDVHVLEAEHARPLEVGDEDRVVDRRAVARGRRLKVAHRVEVRDVDAVLVGLRAVGAVLLHVEREEADVEAAALLEGEERLRLVRELLRVRLAQPLRVLDETLGRVRRHEQRRDDAHRDGLEEDSNVRCGKSGVRHVGEMGGWAKKQILKNKIKM